MGHELTHGFDDEGRQYDGTGTMREIHRTTANNDSMHACIYDVV